MNCKCGCGRKVKGWNYKLKKSTEYIRGHNPPTEESNEKRRQKLKGKPLSEEHKQKISKAHMGKNHWNYKNGVERLPKCADCGKLLSKIYAKRCKSCNRKHIIEIYGILKGKNHYNWQGGKSFEEYGEQFKPLRKVIRQRDNHKCQLCGVPQIECLKKLDVHHINYNKKDNREKNLVSLCHHCHMKTNFNRPYWTKLFQEKVEKICP